MNPDGAPTDYEKLGGEAGVRALVDRFYDLMDSLEEARDVRALHASSLKSSREKLFMFLSGWLGGPPLYWEAYGHPRLRARHLPFAIGAQQRDQWLMCMNRALEETVDDGPLRRQLSDALARMAYHMQNRRE